MNPAAKKEEEKQKEEEEKKKLEEIQKQEAAALQAKQKKPGEDVGDWDYLYGALELFTVSFNLLYRIFFFK